jgi:hypothetical protein
MGLAGASRRRTLMTDDLGELVLTARNASVEGRVMLLHEQHTRKVDVVAPAASSI